MKIKTSAGKEFTARVITPALRNPDALLLEIEDERKLSQIAADFEGVAQLEEVNEQRKTGVGMIYNGYTRLTAISNPEKGVVRLTLEGVSA